MKCIFPDIMQHSRNTLVVIGNGFDLASGIESSYSNFKEWLQKNGNHRLIDLMDTFFSNQRDVWGNIEKALGEYNENNILEYCKPDDDFDCDHPTRSMAAVEDSPDWIFRPILDEFLVEFKNWVDSININNTEKILDLPIECKYFTFNYTETLESVYAIPESNVLHIHGSRLSYKEYIIGHNHYRDPKGLYNDECQMLYMQEAKSKIIEGMNGLIKNTTAIIHQNQNFFNRLSDIEQVVVYGYSFSEVDLPYMEEIVKNIGISKPWAIFYHAPEDLMRIKSFENKVGVKNVRTFEW